MASSASDGGVAHLVVATTNPNKLREIRGILTGLPLQVVSLADHPAVPEPEEHGATFAENASDKALYYARALSALVVAEDSGLEVDGLYGAPGVTSARFGGDAAPTYEAKFQLIFEGLRARGLATSAARFVCALAVAVPGRIVFEASGTIEGEVAPEPRGTEGFGYDPIFFYPPFGCTLAEVPAARKAEVSHRGNAFRVLASFVAQGGLGDAIRSGR